MAKIYFELDTKTMEGRASIDGKEIPSCSSFSYYSYDKGFDLSIQEKELEMSDGLDVYTTHRACGSEIISITSEDGKKSMSAFAKNIFKRNQ